MENNETAEWLQREANNGWTTGYHHITMAGGRKRTGEYPAYEEYLNIHNNETAYVNKLRRPANIKKSAMSIIIVMLIFAPAIVGIFYLGSHIFNSITNGNTEATPQVTTSAPTNTPTETQTPAPTETATGEATESTQARPEPYVNEQGHTVYPAVDDNKTVANTASSVLQAVKRFIIKSIPYILVFLLVISILALLS